MCRHRWCELKDEGFPLVGGRMDYVDGHQAAVVVYRHAKHVINLFAWASPGKANDGAARGIATGLQPGHLAA